MVGNLTKVILNLPQRCKGIAGQMKFFAEDTEEFKRTMKLFLDDKPGGFASSENRLPVRAYYVQFSLLSHDEQNMVMRRMVQFVHHWFHVVGKTCDEGWVDCFAEPIDYNELADMIMDPPAGFLPNGE
jgi:hypothetical protein